MDGFTASPENLKDSYRTWTTLSIRTDNRQTKLNTTEIESRGMKQ